MPCSAGKINLCCLCKLGIKKFRGRYIEKKILERLGVKFSERHRYKQVIVHKNCYRKFHHVTVTGVGLSTWLKRINTN
jgi:hypothetical protein